MSKPKGHQLARKAGLRIKEKVVQGGETMKDKTLPELIRKESQEMT